MIYLLMNKMRLRKWNLTAFTAIITLCSCTDMEEPVGYGSVAVSAFMVSTETQIGVEEALQIAMEATGMLEDSSTRSSDRRSLSRLDAVRYVVGATT